LLVELLLMGWLELLCRQWWQKVAPLNGGPEPLCSLSDFAAIPVIGW
jgi:hypothetical protein